MMSSGESFRVAAFVRRVVGACGFEVRVKKQSLVFATRQRQGIAFLSVSCVRVLVTPSLRVPR